MFPAPKRSPSLLAVGVSLAVIFTLLGYQWSTLALVYIFKPLATLLIIGLALQNWSRCKSAYCQSIVTGLCFSLLGDLLLIWPDQYFLAGLCAFLLAHVAYLLAFNRDAGFPARLPVLLIYLTIGALSYGVLFPTLPAGLRVPVALYAMLLAAMAGQAMSRSLELRTSASQCAAIGAIFFMLSDLLLAFHRFRTPLLYSDSFILVPYYLGQWLIASSTAENGPPA
jgi:uncharacterized membrane protein YhhN